MSPSAGWRAAALGVLTAAVALAASVAISGALSRAAWDAQVIRGLVEARALAVAEDPAATAEALRAASPAIRRIAVMDAGGVDEWGMARDQGLRADTAGRTGPLSDEDRPLAVRSNELIDAVESGRPLSLGDLARALPDGGLAITVPVLSAGEPAGAVIVERAPADPSIPAWLALALGLVGAGVSLATARLMPRRPRNAALVAGAILAVAGAAAVLALTPSTPDGGALLARATAEVGAIAPVDLDASVLEPALAQIRAREAGTLAPLVGGLALLLLLASLLTVPLSRFLVDLRRQPGTYGYVGPALVSTLVLVFVPFLMGVGLAFFSAGKGGPETWTFIGLDNFAEILFPPDTGDTNFYFTLGMTVAWTVLNVFLHVTIGLGLALLLNRPSLRFRAAYRVLLIVPWAVPNYITALIWKWMFNTQYGVINQLLAMVGVSPVDWLGQSLLTNFLANLITNTWLGFPFMMVVSLGALQSIPKELYEAASIDGATRWQQFRTITLPLLKPALFPAIILGTIWTFNMFNIIYLVSGGGPDNQTNILITEAYRAFKVLGRYGFAAAYSLLIFVILFLYATVTNRVTRATEGAFE
ncbi:MAG: hypothetical protein AMXMBFR64_56640 [Myxococcales bacterium]